MPFRNYPVKDVGVVQHTAAGPLRSPVPRDAHVVSRDQEEGHSKQEYMLVQEMNQTLTTRRLTVQEVRPHQTGKEVKEQPT